MSRALCTYTCIGVKNNAMRVVPGASVSIFEIDGVTPIQAARYTTPTGSAVTISNPVVSGPNGAISPFYLNTPQYAVISWTASGFAGGTDIIAIGSPDVQSSGVTPVGPAGGVLTGTYPNPGLAAGVALSQVQEIIAMSDLADVSGTFAAGSSLRRDATGFKPSGLQFSAVVYGVERVGTDSAATAAANGAALDACIAAAVAAGEGSTVSLDWIGTVQLPGGHKYYSRLIYRGTLFNKSKLMDGAPAGKNLYETATFGTNTQSLPSAVTYATGEWEFQFLDHIVDGNKANNATGGRGVALFGYGYYVDRVLIENCHQAGWWAEWPIGSEPVVAGVGSRRLRAATVGAILLVNNDCASVAAVNQRATDLKGALPCAQATVFGPGDSWIGYLEAFRNGSVAGTGLGTYTMDYTTGTYTNFDLTVDNLTVWLNHDIGVDLNGSGFHCKYIHSEGANTNLRANNQSIHILDGKLFAAQPGGTNLNIVSGFNFSYINVHMPSTGNAGVTYLNVAASTCTEAELHVHAELGNAVTVTVTAGSLPTAAKLLDLSFNNYGSATITAGWMPLQTGSTTLYKLLWSRSPFSWGFFTKAGVPTAADVGLTANGMAALYKDSSGGTIKLYANDGGTIKAVALA